MHCIVRMLSQHDCVCKFQALSIHAEGKVAESEPVRRPDVVREQDETSVDELPARGQTRQICAQWITMNSDSVTGRSQPPQPVALYDDDVCNQPSVVENQPSRRIDVVREEDDTEAEVLLKRGFARDLAGFWSAPREPEVTVPRETVDMAALRGASDAGVVENQPRRLEGVVRADDPVEDESWNIERGLTRSLATQWSTQRDTQTTKEPFRIELDVDPNETAVFENEPQQLEGVIRCSEPLRETMGQRGQIRHITRRYTASPADIPRRRPDMIDIDLADGPTVLENEPAAVDPSVVRSVWTDVDDGAPQPGMTRSMLQRWACQDIQDDDRSTLTKPAWLVEWETTPEGSGVFENMPTMRDDVIREEDYEPEMIPVRQTRRTRALWSRLERDDGVEHVSIITPEV